VVVVIEGLIEWRVSARERRAVLTSAQCRERAAAGTLRTDGSDLVPVHMLWFRSADVVAYAQRSLGADLDRYLVAAGLRPSSGKTNGAWDAMSRREWVKYETADRMVCAIGLTTAFLGDPVFAPCAPSNPQLRAAAS
jgi:hypothetical protein